MTTAELMLRFDSEVYDSNLASEQLHKINKIIRGRYPDTNPWGLPVIQEGVGGRLLGSIEVVLSEEAYALAMHRVAAEDLLSGITVEVEWVDENTY